MKTVKCAVLNEEGSKVGEIELSAEEANHFDNSGLHNADISLTNEQQRWFFGGNGADNYVLIRSIN